MMVIHQADTDLHHPPPGWHYVTQEPAVMPRLDAEVWYVRADDE